MQQRLEKEDVGKLLYALIFPSVLAQLVTLLYNLVDKIFVGRIENGTIAIAAVGVCSALILVVVGVSNLFGRGGAPVCSIFWGRNDLEKANKTMNLCFLGLIVTSVILSFIYIIFGKEILLVFGASEKTLLYAYDYLRIYSYGIIFVQLAVGLNSFIVCQGHSKYAMYTLVVGSILNIILDFLFIIIFNMGVKGAAIATILSQFVSFLMVMLFLFSKHSILKLKIEYLKPDRRILKLVISLGLTPFFMYTTDGLFQAIFNRQMFVYGGDVAVSIATIIFSIQQIVYLPIQGIAQASQPIVSYNYGALNYERVLEAIKKTIRISAVFTIICLIFIFLFTDKFSSLFTSDANLIEKSNLLIIVFMSAYVFMSVNEIYQQTYNSLGNGRYAFAFSFFRKIIVTLPVIFILPRYFQNGVLAVAMTEPIADTLQCVLNGIVFRRFIYKKIIKKRRDI